MPDPSNHSPERYLRVDHLSGDLRRRTVRGGVVTLVNQGAKFVLMIGSTAALARLLTPEDFGLIAMVMAVIGFISSLKDMGLAMATVQRHDVTHQQVSTLFWINLGLSTLIALATVALAPFFGWLYKEPRVTGITLALAASIIFSGLGVQHQALLRRQMQFGATAVIEFCSLVISFAAGIVAAVSGLGYWSLVIIPIIRESVASAGVWIACRWRPGRMDRHSGVRSMLSFGINLTGFNIVNYFARNLDKILIGRIFGATPAGLYSKAYQLVLLPTQQINAPLSSVAVPTLSRLQKQMERFRAYFRRGLTLAAGIGMPLVAFLCVDAREAILTVLGSQWTESIPLFRALAPAAFLATTSVANGWVFVALGETKRQFIWGIWGSAATALAFFIGLRWGPLGVAAAFSTSVVVLRLPSIWYCFKGTPLRLADFLAAIWRPGVSSIVAAMLLLLINQIAEWPISIYAEFVIDFLIYAALYPLVWIVLPGGRRSAGDLIALVKDLKPDPSASPIPEA